MSELNTTNYHFCTLNELQSPKQMPSLNFVAKIIDICHVPITLFESPQRNIYDRKNHILHINNYDSYARILQDKYGRSVASFEKQLKMMGFKKRKYKLHSTQSFTDLKIQLNLQGQKISFIQQDKEESKRDQVKRENLERQEVNNKLFNPQSQIKKQKSNQTKYMLVWKTNRPALIEKELQSLQVAFSEQVERALAMRQRMEKRKKELDERLETIILNNLLNYHQNCEGELQTEVCSYNGRRGRQETRSETIMSRCIQEGLRQLRELSNESQIQSRRLIKSISQNSGKQLQLFRILIYKQSNIDKSIVEQ